MRTSTIPAALISLIISLTLNSRAYGAANERDVGPVVRTFERIEDACENALYRFSFIKAVDHAVIWSHLYVNALTNYYRLSKAARPGYAKFSNREAIKQERDARARTLASTHPLVWKDWVKIAVEREATVRALVSEAFEVLAPANGVYLFRAGRRLPGYYGDDNVLVLKDSLVVGVVHFKGDVFKEIQWLKTN